MSRVDVYDLPFHDFEADSILIVYSFYCFLVDNYCKNGYIMNHEQK